MDIIGPSRPPIAITAVENNDGMIGPSRPPPTTDVIGPSRPPPESNIIGPSRPPMELLESASRDMASIHAQENDEYAIGPVPAVMST